MFGRRTAGVVQLDDVRQQRTTPLPDRERPPAPAAETSPHGTAAAPPDTPEDTAEEHYRDDVVARLTAETLEVAERAYGSEDREGMSRKALAARIQATADRLAAAAALKISGTERREVVTGVVNELLPVPATAVPCAPADTVESAKLRVQPLLMDRIDMSKAAQVPRAELAAQIGDIVAEILAEERVHLNLLEQRDLVTSLLNDMLGFGPLEVLLNDEAVTDIMVNGPKQVFVERGGKLELSGVQFRDNTHVMQIATRIVNGVGRRVDESTPLVDARLPDGSRVNIIIPPLAIDGPSISIRKFAKKKITLDIMTRQGNISPAMETVLKIASRSRLNILISGGTGSGKTTLLNAMSRMIDEGERIVTIEDAAELQLQQPHVVRLETRPANLEGDGEITQRELVKNALRMRPDRIILGEIRAGEALDMLQAMNTGHDGSMCTIHANRPREALTRLENMVAMAGTKLPNEAVRSQIAGAVNLIVQISRMRDGVRRITHVTEVVGMEGEVVTTQDLFVFNYEGEDASGRLSGRFESTGLRPHFAERARYFGLDKALLEAMG